MFGIPTLREGTSLCSCADRTAPRPSLLGLSALLTAATLLLTPSTARAQADTFYLDRIQVSGAPQDGFAVWRPRMAERTEFFAAGALGYTFNPLRTRAVTDDPLTERTQPNPVQHQLIAHLSAGVQLMNRVSVGLSLPVTAYQKVGDAEPAYPVSVEAAALHDLRTDLRVRMFSSDDDSAHLGAGVALWFPTGNPSSLASDDETTVFPYLTGEAGGDTMFFAGHIGPHFRPLRSFPDPDQSSPVLEVENELRFSSGLFFPSRNGDTLVGASLWGTTGIASGTFLGAYNTDLEWLVEWYETLSESGKSYIRLGGGTRLTNGYGAPDVRVLAMIGTHGPLSPVEVKGEPRIKVKHPPIEPDKDTDGDGYPDEIDSCPLVKEDGKEPKPSDGCPAPSDRDKDGIVDAEDKCPDDPEDQDSFEDSDGCPEDNDKDGILDAEDACPLVPGVRQEDPDKNGCPKERKKIVEEDGEIRLLEPIQFETAKSTIKPVSFPILDEVVDVMKTRPDIRVAVHGHTDIRGGYEMNMKLSRDRAASVMKYLQDHGIDGGRLESDGFGPNKPIDTNETPEGRQKNRRVEFKILD